MKSLGSRVKRREYSNARNDGSETRTKSVVRKKLWYLSVTIMGSMMRTTDHSISITSNAKHRFIRLTVAYDSMDFRVRQADTLRVFIMYTGPKWVDALLFTRVLHSLEACHFSVTDVWEANVKCQGVRERDHIVSKFEDNDMEGMLVT